MRPTLRFLAIFIALTTFAAEASTPAPAREWFEHSLENAWQQNPDPTLVSRRAYSEFTYQDLDGGRSMYEIDPTVRGAHPLFKNIALGYTGTHQHL